MFVDISNLGDEALLEMIGHRLRRLRLDRDIARQQLAAAADVSVDTVRNAEQGQNVSLQTLVRLLRALDRVRDLEPLLAEPEVSPVELAERLGRQRQRASGSRKISRKQHWSW